MNTNMHSFREMYSLVKVKGQSLVGSFTFHVCYSNCEDICNIKFHCAKDEFIDLHAQQCIVGT